MANVAVMAATISAAAEKRVIEQLRGKGADAHQRAASFLPAQRGDERYLDSLLDRGVVVEAGPGRYWVNERTLRSRATTGKTVLLLVLVLLLFSVGVLLLAAAR